VRFEKGIGRRASAEVVTLDEALPQADYVSLHVPLIKDGPEPTYHLMSTPRFRQMKRTAYLVNTSRGPVVDEAALAGAVREGLIAGAALDVFEKEPLPLASPLLAKDLADRIRVYHHFASGTKETRLSVDPEVGMAGRCVAGLLDALSAKPTYRFAVVRPS
jgi:phosphoglycerate dehydrogenase-like enzyme